MLCLKYCQFVFPELNRIKVLLNILLCCFAIDNCLAKTVTIRLEGHPIYVFNGLPKPNGWGEDLVYQAKPSNMDTRTMGGLGGIPIVDIWNKTIASLKK